jgi:hypothetical protein
MQMSHFKTTAIIVYGPGTAEKAFPEGDGPSSCFPNGPEKRVGHFYKTNQPVLYWASRSTIAFRIM